MPNLSRAARSSLALCFLAAAGLHVWRGWAEWGWRRAGGPEAAERACGWTPSNAECWRAAARLEEQSGGEALPLWLRSLSLDSRNAEVALAAAPLLEAAGQTGEAERVLLRAVGYNRLWKPRWGLALFYARRGRRAEFWQWARAAFERSYWDRTAMFRTCSAEGGTAAFLLRSVLPARLDLRLALVRYLAGQGGETGLEEAAQAVVECARPEQRDEAVPVLLDAIGTLARGGRARHAFAVWAALCRARLLPYEEPGEVDPVTNPWLCGPFPGSGFDWQTPTASGVTSLALTGGAGLRFTLTGWQDGSIVLLQQWLFLRGGRRWRLRVEGRTQGIDAADSGLYWRLLDGETGLPYEPDGAPMAGEDWTALERSFAGPAGDRLMRLALVAAPRAGRIRMQGDVWVRRVDLRMEGMP